MIKVENNTRVHFYHYVCTFVLLKAAILMSSLLSDDYRKLQMGEVSSLHFILLLFYPNLKIEEYVIEIQKYAYDYKRFTILLYRQKSSTKNAKYFLQTRIFTLDIKEKTGVATCHLPLASSWWDSNFGVHPQSASHSIICDVRQMTPLVTFLNREECCRKSVIDVFPLIVVKLDKFINRC